jgi:hypothetical protein
MCCDSYYHGQAYSLVRLINDFERTNGRLILGGAIWGKVRSRVSHILRPDVTWFDKWAVPELRFMPHGWDPQKDYVAFRVRVPVKGFFRTHSVPGVHIFPRSVWDEGHRYGVVEDLHGCEQTPLCENSGLPCYVDFNANFYREKIYSIPHCIRNSLHLGRIRRRLMNSGPEIESVPPDPPSLGYLG